MRKTLAEMNEKEIQDAVKFHAEKLDVMIHNCVLFKEHNDLSMTLYFECGDFEKYMNQLINKTILEAQLYFTVLEDDKYVVDMNAKSISSVTVRLDTENIKLEEDINAAQELYVYLCRGGDWVYL